MTERHEKSEEPGHESIPEDATVFQVLMQFWGVARKRARERDRELRGSVQRQLHFPTVLPHGEIIPYLSRCLM